MTRTADVTEALDASGAATHGGSGLATVAARDDAQHRRLNAVAPGLIATALMQRFSGGARERRERVIAQEPAGRMGTPEEIAAAVPWLCSDAASVVTGATLIADGGQTVSGRPAPDGPAGRYARLRKTGAPCRPWPLTAHAIPWHAGDRG